MRVDSPVGMEGVGENRSMDCKTLSWTHLIVGGKYTVIRNRCYRCQLCNLDVDEVRLLFLRDNLVKPKPVIVEERPR